MTIRIIDAAQRTLMTRQRTLTSLLRLEARMLPKTLPLLAILLLIATAVLAGPLGGATAPSEIPSVRLEIRPLDKDFVAGTTVRIGLFYNVPESTHMTGTFRAVTVEGAEAGQAVFPPLSVEGEIGYWKGDVMAVLPVVLPGDEGPFELVITAESQLCREGNASLCYAPTSATATLEIVVTPGDRTGTSAVTAGSDAPDQGGLEGRLNQALNGRLWLAFLIVFVGGFLTSLTPCVLPMIPITIGFIGMSAKGNALKGFVLSLWYVLGIAIIYSTLGVLSAAAGGAFGQFTQTPWFMGPIAALIFAMGLSMAGLFEMRMPSSLANQAGGGKRGFLGPLLMGMAMGIVAVACVGPVLVVLLTWVATTGSLFLGFWLLFTFALGMGVLFVVFGTFGGMLPTGGWMETVKHGFALLMFALALWFVRIYLPEWLTPALYGLILMFSVSAWGAWKSLPNEAGARAGLDKGLLKFLWLLGASLAILGALNGLAPELLPTGRGGDAVSEALHREPAWVMDETIGFTEAARDGKPVMMDFYADWCAACIELDHKTYNQPEVLALAEQFVSVKMDMTTRSEINDARNRKYQVVGMPTVIFFDAGGRELERFSGFKDAEDMTAVMQRVLQRVGQ